MARLIIGHTTHNSTNVWVRGTDRYPHAFVRITGQNKNQLKKLSLEERHGYTGVVRFTGLAPRTAYSVTARFGSEPDAPPASRFDFGHCDGNLSTFPAPASNANLNFILLSCNLHSLGAFWNPDFAYTRIAEEVNASAADFIIHCGDQIYYDVPITQVPTYDRYRRKYLDAWSDSRPTRQLLTQLPQYMILDDHEIIDNFSNDKSHVGPTTLDTFKTAGLKVYREFQWSHSPRNHGNDALHYHFRHGRNHFFVLDSRSERFKEQKQIISPDQMRRFRNWLRNHANEKKFVVTSVPFVAQPRTSKDKWSYFSEQRHEIIDYVFDHGIKRLVFLCGDQHNSHYATMRLTDGSKSSTIHELMSSPVNQIQKSRYSDYVSPYNATTAKGTQYTVTIKRSDFYNAHSNAMAISVSGNQVRHRIFRTKSRNSGTSVREFTI